MSAAHQESFGVLTRNDLRTFDDKATEIILAAMELGAVGRISSKGHAILRAPNGMTMSVSRNQTSANRARQNTERDFRQMFPDADTAPKPAPPKRSNVTPLVSMNNGETTFECPAKGCPETFTVYGALYSHVEKEHEKCDEDGCDYVGTNHVATRAHARIVHEGARPHAGRGKKQKADKTLADIRALLGPDPRVQELEAEVATLVKERDALQAKLDKLMEVLGK